VSFDFIHIITVLLAFLLSLSFHEWAHAAVALVNGDDTAKRLGRLTLNPVAHIDVVGTILLPLGAAVAGLPFIGWAKPVPVEVQRLRSRRRGTLFVAAAGPAANLFLAFVCILLLSVYSRFFKDVLDATHFLFPLVKLIDTMVIVNAFLAFFNLIPLPPLDGGIVLSQLLPKRMGEAYQRTIAPMGFILLIMIMISGGLWWLPKLAYSYLAICQTVVSMFL
jgi:Zn-dependent protease